MEEDQKLQDIVKAVEKETGMRVHRSMAIRWVKRGVRGVLLESRQVGGRYLTSIEWVRHFIDSRSSLLKVDQSDLQLQPRIAELKKQIDQATNKLSRMTNRKGKPLAAYLEDK